MQSTHVQGYDKYTWLTVTISVLVLVTSSAGIFIKNTYAKESISWALQAIGQDMANIVSIPMFLACSYFANNNNKKESIKALTVWMGVMFFLVYAFAIYAFDIHYNSLFLVYVAFWVCHFIPCLEE
jgi:low temperature requirement protein LtrA